MGREVASVVLVADAATCFQRIEDAGDVGRGYAQKERPARRKSHARTLRAAPQTADSLDLNIDAAPAHAPLKGVGEGNAAPGRAAWLVRAESVVYADDDRLRSMRRGRFCHASFPYAKSPGLSMGTAYGGRRRRFVR